MKRTKILLILAAISIILSVGGSQALALTGYGSFVASNEITRAFSSHQVDPNLNYYICGSLVFPDAIIGIDKRYTLDSDLWQRIEVTPKSFAALITNMQIGYSNLAGANLHGFAILDEMGMRIGTWYSPLGTPFSSYVKMTGERRVHVQTVASGHAAFAR